jgi:hypothetical protein
VYAVLVAQATAAAQNDYSDMDAELTRVAVNNGLPITSYSVSSSVSSHGNGNTVSYTNGVVTYSNSASASAHAGR